MSGLWEDIKNYLADVADDIEKDRRRALAIATIKWYNDNSGENCNLCHEHYRGLAGDCRCTKYGFSSWREAPRKDRPWYWKWWPEAK